MPSLFREWCALKSGFVLDSRGVPSQGRSRKPGAGRGSPLRVTPLYRMILRLRVTAMSPPASPRTPCHGLRRCGVAGPLRCWHGHGPGRTGRVPWAWLSSSRLTSSSACCGSSAYGGWWPGGTGWGWGEAAAAVLRVVAGRHCEQGLRGSQEDGARELDRVRLVWAYFQHSLKL